MILLIDVGNTRIKWATLDQHDLGSQQAAVYQGWDSAQLYARVLAPHITPHSRLQRVLVANVGGEAIATAIQTACQQYLKITAEFLHSSNQLGGVLNAYRDPSQLGVDRFMALIGARALAPNAIICIVDVGTAMTIDALLASGEHIGGSILAGPALLINSLLHHTSDIATRAQTSDRDSHLFTNNTYSAIQQGARYALAALIHEAMQMLVAQYQQQPTLLLTGGGYECVSALLRYPARHVPDLVLQGMAVVAHWPTKPHPI